MQVRTYLAIEVKDLLDRLQLLVWSLGKTCNRGRNKAFYDRAIAQGLIPEIDWEAIGVRTTPEMFSKILGVRTAANYGIDAFTQVRAGAQLRHLVKLEAGTGYALLSERDRREVVRSLLELVDATVALEGKEEAIAQMDAMKAKWLNGASSESVVVADSPDPQSELVSAPD